MSVAMPPSNHQLSADLKRRNRNLAMVLGLVALSFFFAALYLFVG